MDNFDKKIFINQLNYKQNFTEWYWSLKSNYSPNETDSTI